MTEASAQVILLRDRVIALDVVADGIFGEGQVLREVISGFPCDICSRS